MHVEDSLKFKREDPAKQQQERVTLGKDLKTFHRFIEYEL